MTLYDKRSSDYDDLDDQGAGAGERLLAPEPAGDPDLSRTKRGQQDDDSWQEVKTPSESGTSRTSLGSSSAVAAPPARVDRIGKSKQKSSNPLGRYSHEELEALGEDYAERHGLIHDVDVRAFRIGAVLAQGPDAWSTIDDLTNEERIKLSLEATKKWQQPKILYLIVALCSTCAAVQGMGISSRVKICAWSWLMAGR